MDVSRGSEGFWEGVNIKLREGTEERETTQVASLADAED